MDAVTWAGLTLAAAASWSDVRTGRVPDLLVGIFLAAGVLLGAADSGLPGVARALAGAAVGFALLLPAGLFGVLGGGDVKYAAAAGALLGPWRALLATALGAIVAGLALSAARRIGERRRAIPVAPAFAAATAAVLLAHLVLPSPESAP